MDEKEARKLVARCKRYAFKLIGNEQEAEEIAQDAVIFALEQRARKDCPYFRISWLVIGALRRDHGKPGTRRFKLFWDIRNGKRIAPIENEEDFGEYISEEQIHSGESHDHGNDSPIDLECLEAVGGFPEHERTGREEARSRGVTESAISKLRKRKEKKLVRAYLWEHYKAHGIESELEIEWLEI